jgi:hypothetical protein
MHIGGKPATVFFVLHFVLVVPKSFMLKLKASQELIPY